MATERKKNRISKYSVIFPTLKILQEHVGENNGTSIKNICAEIGLKDPTLKGFSRNTMGDLLSDLTSDFTLGGRIKCKYGPEEGRVYYYNYYFEPYVSQEELQLIIDDIRASVLHSSSKGKTLVRKLKMLFPKSMQDKIKNTKVAFASNAIMDDHTDKNLQFIKEIIKYNDEHQYEEMVLQFIMKGYGIGDERYPARYSDGNIKRYEVLPLAIALIDNRYYLLGYWKDNNEPSVHRIDLMFDLEKEIRNADLKDNNKQKVKNMLVGEALQEFIVQHAYASYGKKHTYRIRAKAINNAFTYVQGIVGPNYKLDHVKGNPNEAEFYYTCPQRTMEILIRQYMGNLKVVGPGPEKEEIEKSIVDTLLKDEDYRKVLKERLIESE